ncbi:PAS domain S-box protein [Aquisediminimonas profunda]|uniref:PAS domain S-box protein n=1 Tax=Aquisediminimonas profunda TaxID=1550733 RepID=UPI001C63A790|nr:PAS domain S-box protein [Aquisediminimonas profunda]
MNAFLKDSFNEGHLRSILATVPDAMVVIDDRGRIMSFSTAAERMFGFSQAEVVGENVSLLMPSPDRERHDNYIERYRQTEERHILGIGRVMTARRRDGSTFPIELSVGEAKTPEGRVFTGFIRDLTEQQSVERRMHELQNELARVARISAVGSLTTALAHELNQPLAAITNYMEAAQELVDTSDADPEYLREAMSSAAEQAMRAAKIVSRLREFISRGEASRRTESLGKLVREATALALLGSGKDEIEMRVALDPQSDRVNVNGINVQQVLFNLVRNALDAMEDLPIKRIEISSEPVANGMVQLTISDTGSGILPEMADDLFEPFRSTKRSGMGLGLSICRTLVEAQGGRIWVEPGKAGGSRFSFTLPLSEPAIA